MIKRGDTIETHKNGWIVSRGGVSVAIVAYRGIALQVAIPDIFSRGGVRYETQKLPKIRSVIPPYLLGKAENTLLTDFMVWQQSLARWTIGANLRRLIQRNRAAEWGYKRRSGRKADPIIWEEVTQC